MAVTTAAALAAEFRLHAGRIPELLDVVVRKTAFDVAADAMALAPVDTGALRASISVSPTTVTAAGISAEVGPTVHYGGYVELGTYKMKPQPYLAPAAERRRAAFISAVTRVSLL